jgi:ABC-type phosphate/phosphonate transport system permease subunit
MTIEAGSPMDEPWIRQLLTLCGLLENDLTPPHLGHFFAMKEKGQLIGVIGSTIAMAAVGLTAAAMAVVPLGLAAWWQVRGRLARSLQA